MVQVIYFVLGGVLIGVLFLVAARRAKQLNDKIEKYREEQSRTARNPYAAMAQLYDNDLSAEETLDTIRRQNSHRN